MEARLKTGLWVQATLRTANAAGRFGVVVRRGDADSGGVLVLLRGRDGVAVLSQVRAGDGRLAWLRATGADPVGEAAADEYVARQVRADPDVWVIEFESPDMQPPFEARLIE